MTEPPEVFREIPQFPDYSVSTLGRVVNQHTGRDMKISLNTRGIPIVGMMFNGTQYKRSVPLMVAQAFLEAPIHESFDSVIHLDGDRTNSRASNLMWRPHWFVIRYHQQQFRPDSLRFLNPIHCPETDEWFENSGHMARTYGLLERDIVEAHVNGHMIWPTKLSVDRVLL